MTSPPSAPLIFTRPGPPWSRTAGEVIGAGGEGTNLSFTVVWYDKQGGHAETNDYTGTIDPNGGSLRGTGVNIAGVRNDWVAHEHFRVQQVVEPTLKTRSVELIPADRRPSDDEIATLDASLPNQPQHVGVVLTGLREPSGPWGPGRPVHASDAFEAVRVVGRQRASS